MKMFGMCIDKRVIAGVVVAGALVWLLAPQAFIAALPFLLIAICPLSMLLMMKMMSGQASPEQQAPAAAPAATGEAAAAAGTQADQPKAATLGETAADLDARRN